ncbi:MAG: ATP-binding protein [Steroidobacteraceae bacterium]
MKRQPEPRSKAQFIAEIAQRTGSALWVRVTTALVREGRSAPQCSVEFLRDITIRIEMVARLEQHQVLLESAVMELKASGDKYRMLIENTSAVPWELDRETGWAVYIGTQIKMILEPALFDPNALEFVDLLHASDREKFLGFIKTFRGGEAGADGISTRRLENWAEIRIQDSGCGIPAGIRDWIFDPFFTTKAVGKGTGQGFTIAHDVVVKKHGGSIMVESNPGEGTTFILRLPLDVAAKAAAAAV